MNTQAKLELNCRNHGVLERSVAKTDMALQSGALCVIFMILVSLENVKKCVLGGCTVSITSKHCALF